MNCEVCGLDSANDARFCSDCGAELHPSYDGETDVSPLATPIDIRQAYGATRAPARAGGEESQERGDTAADAESSQWDEPQPRAGDTEDTPEREAAVLPAPLPPGSHGAEIPTSTIGELLLRARVTYVRRFWLFFPLGALPQIPLLVSPLNIEEPSVAGIFSLFFSLLLLVVTTAATIFAVAHVVVYERVHFSRCLAEAAQVALPMLLVQLIIGFSLVASAILMAVLIGFPLFVYFLVTLYFAPHAVAIERLNPLFALGRSRQLVRGHIVRVFVIGSMFILVAVFILMAFFIPARFIAPEDTTTLNLVLAFAASLAAPLITIGGTLTYFDLRTRSEGYDLGQLKSELERE